MMDLSKKAKKALHNWAADGYYVYIRPTTIRWYRPNDEHTLFWNVTVEYRNSEWTIWDAKGDNLDLILREMAENIPRRSKLDESFVPATVKSSPMVGISRALHKLPRPKKNKVYLEIRKSATDPKPKKRTKKDKK